MHSKPLGAPPARRVTGPAALAAFCLLSVGVTILLAHEGHAPLPTKGVQVDVARGHLLLTPTARDGLDVSTSEVELRPVEERLLAYATVTVPWTHHGFATSRLPGRVTAVHVTPGQIVRAGDVVAEVQSLELETLQLDLLTVRNDAALGQKVVKELRTSAEKGAVAGQSVYDAESKLAQAEVALAVAKSKWVALGLTEKDLETLYQRNAAAAGLTLPVRTPVSGTVIHAELVAGQVVEPTDHLAEVTDISTVWARLGVLEKDVYRVAVGTPVELKLAAYPGKVVRTTVSSTAPFLDPVTHLMFVWAELQNPSVGEPTYVPGMAGQADIVLGSERTRPTVPVSAVVREGAERFVLVEEANATGAAEFRRKPVALGRHGGGRVEVVAGDVFPGDRVVTRGSTELGGFFAPGVLRLDPVTERAIGLRVEPAAVRTVDEVVALDGAVDFPPRSRGVASSPLAGTITAVRTDRGRPVKAGDVLAELFSTEFQTLQFDLIRAALEHRLEADVLKRIKDLPGVARQRVWQAESRVASLAAQVDVLRRKLETVGLTAGQVDEIARTNRVVTAVPVRAPAAGVVVAFDRAIGQAVTAREGLFELHDPARAAVMGFVPEREGARIHVGQAVRIRLTAAPDVVRTGRIARSGRAVGTDNRSQAVWVDLDPPDSAQPANPLIHGQLAALSVVTGSGPAALTVPRAAVIDDGGQGFVFVRKPDGVFERRAVDMGPADDTRVVVAGGLVAGEHVAVSGVQDLATGFASLK